MSKSKSENAFLSEESVPYTYLTEENELVKNAQLYLETKESIEMLNSLERNKLIAVVEEYQTSKSLSVESTNILILIQKSRIEKKLSKQFLLFAEFFQKTFKTLIQSDHRTVDNLFEAFSKGFNEDKNYYHDILTKLRTSKEGDLKYHMMCGVETDRINFFQKPDTGWTIFWQEFLKDARIDPSQNENATILWAVANNHTLVVQLLLKDNRVTHSNGAYHALKAAAEHGNTKMLRFLLASANCNFPDDVLKQLIKDDRFTPEVKAMLINPLWKKLSLFAINKHLPEEVNKIITLQYCRC